jgi:hypothetical protein
MLFRGWPRHRQIPRLWPGKAPATGYRLEARNEGGVFLSLVQHLNDNPSVGDERPVRHQHVFVWDVAISSSVSHGSAGDCRAPSLRLRSQTVSEAEPCGSSHPEECGYLSLHLRLGAQIGQSTQGGTKLRKFRLTGGMWGCRLSITLQVRSASRNPSFEVDPLHISEAWSSFRL